MSMSIKDMEDMVEIMQDMMKILASMKILNNIEGIECDSIELLNFDSNL